MKFEEFCALMSKLMLETGIFTRIIQRSEYMVLNSLPTGYQCLFQS